MIFYPYLSYVFGEIVNLYRPLHIEKSKYIIGILVLMSCTPVHLVQGITIDIYIPQDKRYSVVNNDDKGFLKLGFLYRSCTK